MNRTETLQQIARLRQLSTLILDARLMELHVAATARQVSLDRLADLDSPAGATDLPEMTAIDVSLRYERWADQRRAELNLILARQTVDWIEARQTAALAFGKSEALARLSQRRK